MKDKFLDDPDLQDIQLLRKWASPSNMLVQGLHKPDLFIVPVELAGKVAAKTITFEEIATSCEVKYAHFSHLFSEASDQASEIALFLVFEGPVLGPQKDQGPDQTRPI